MTVSVQESTELLARFVAACNRHDLDAIMACMADDCVYLASLGPDPDGTVWVGHQQVREGFARFFTSFPDGRYDDVRSFVAGDRAASEWTFSYTAPNGSRQGYRGCDLFELAGGTIRRKDAFRKQHGQWPNPARDRVDVP